MGGDWRGEEWEQGDQLACQGMRLELPGLGQQHWRQIGSIYFQEKVSKNFQCILNGNEGKKGFKENS